MNTGQGLLTILSMLLLSSLILRVNSTNMSSGNVVIRSKYSTEALSVAETRLEEITGNSGNTGKSKAFDEFTVHTNLSSLNQLTAPANLGPDAGETYPNFDDVDDYNKFATTDTVWPDPSNSRMFDTFRDSCSVFYVKEYPDSISSVASYYKKIVVFVTGKYMQGDTVKISTVFSYFLFR